LAGCEILLSADLPRDLPGARVFLYLTEQEGLGSAVLLAMSAGVPVLASAIGGLPEIVRDGDTGLLTINEPGSVAVRLRRLLDDPALCGKLAAAGKRQVSERFTIDRMVDATVTVYREISG
jgi:glycosyltransferase involved in cell wall biosynthesis